MNDKREITIEIKNPQIILLLIILTVFFILELQVSVNSPIAFGDEGTHVKDAQYFAENREYPAWKSYVDAIDAKQGVYTTSQWHLVQAGFYLLFGFHEIIVKFITPFIASLLFGLVIFILGKKIYTDEVGFVASLVAVSVPSIVTYSVLMYKDSLFMFYFSLFILTHILAFKTNEKKYWLLTGIFAAFSYLTKTPGLVVFPFMFLTFIYNVYLKKNIFKSIKDYLPVVIIFILIIGSYFLREWVYYHSLACHMPILGNPSGCYIPTKYKHQTQYQFEGRTEEVGTEMSFFKMGIMNYLDFAYGIIWFVPLTFLCGLFLITRNLKIVNIFLVFLFISFIPVFKIIYAGRAEDFARYTLGLLPSIALIVGNYFKEMYQFMKKYLKQMALIVFLPVIIFCFLNLNGKLYLARHYDQSSGKYVGYKMFSPLFFEACDWVKQNLNEDVRLGAVIWASPTLYNCQRNTGGGGPDIVLSNNVTLALAASKAQGITHIFIQKFSIDWENRKLAERYPISFVEFLENNPEHFKKVYENGPSLQQCRQIGGCDGTIIYEVVF